MIFVLLITINSPILPCRDLQAKSYNKVCLKIGKKTFRAKFYKNKTAKALLRKLPLRMKMSELNGNEKYKYLGFNLPTNEKKISKIKAGDIMLYGDDCLVIFYKSFETTYEYTRIGRVTDVKKFKKNVGSASIMVLRKRRS
ncbi:MAG: hypothetical protein K6G63_05920 [Eubacterium sp.]|nr:hypothetical protein [Eubacterium sp.]